MCCTRLSFAPVEHAVVRSRLLCLPSVIDAVLVRLSNLPVYVVLTGPLLAELLLVRSYRTAAG